MNRETSALLKQLKKAYQYYVLDDIDNFDQTLRGIVLSFAGDIDKFAMDVDKELGDKFGRRKQRFNRNRPIRS